MPNDTEQGTDHAVHAAEPAVAAGHTLFLPSRLHHASPTKVLPIDFRLQDSQGLPLPNPLRRAGRGYPALRCSPLHRAPLSTIPNKTTKTAKSVMQLDAVGKQLVTIRRSKKLFSNLIQYGDMGLDMGDNANPALFRPGAQTRWFSTWTANGARPIPSAEQQADAIYGASSWFGWTADRPDSVVNCELSVQDEIRIQILELMNLFAQMRYPNTVTDELHNAEDETWEHGIPPGAREADPPPGQAPGAPAAAFMPHWGRPTHAAHKDSRKNPENNQPGVALGLEPQLDQVNGKKQKALAGFPDFLLFGSASHGDYGAIGEGKSPWAVRNEILELLFTRHISERGTGLFDWRYAGLMSQVIRQLWGELEFFFSQLGFFTNGSKAIFYVKPDPEGQELVFSEFQDWEQENLHLAMAGLTFAALDMKDLRDNAGINLIDILCPEADRESDWP